MSSRKKLPPEKTPKLAAAPSRVQWRMDEMEREAKRLAEQVANAFSGSNQPGLRALWMEDHLRALSRLELQFKALGYARQEMLEAVQPEERTPHG
jgi:septal ring factor EnvC (AmiA/AmiB activator)